MKRCQFAKDRHSIITNISEFWKPTRYRYSDNRSTQCLPIFWDYPISVCLYPAFTSMRTPSFPDGGSLFLPVRSRARSSAAMAFRSVQTVPSRAGSGSGSRDPFRLERRLPTRPAICRPPPALDLGFAQFGIMGVGFGIQVGFGVLEASSSARFLHPFSFNHSFSTANFVRWNFLVTFDLFQSRRHIRLIHLLQLGKTRLLPRRVLLPILPDGRSRLPTRRSARRSLPVPLRNSGRRSAAWGSGHTSSLCLFPCPSYRFR